MIASLRGTVQEKGLSEVVVDVGGVGYRVSVSLLALTGIPEVGQSVALRVRTVVREDALDLYGFPSREEEDLFQLLTSVSQVGPKLALAVLSGLEVQELIRAIAKGEIARLTKIRGVGKKTAERLVLELKDKVKLLVLESERGEKKGAPRSVLRDDVVSALVNLGYKDAQAQSAADLAAERTGAEAEFELQFREALKVLRG